MNQYQKIINENSLADIEFRVKWKSLDADHTDATLVMVNFWRDLLPEAVTDALMGIGEGEEKTFRFSPGQLVPAHSDRHQYHLKRSGFNENPRLPFADNAFDCVICTASVEYLINPAVIFEETARVLKPGGILIHTFSNRWFPPKAIRLWTMLHEFERMGLVLEYFLGSGKFEGLETFSSRGWDRPETDKYYPDMPQSDPVFAVWGRKKGS